MKPLAPDISGFVDSEGVRIHYEVSGNASATILLLPTWTIVHKRMWKAQVPYLSRHFRVVSYDGPGNGLSDRPAEGAAYHHDVQVRHALAVLDATGTDSAVLIGLSQGAAWALQLAAQHRDRTLGAIFIAASLAITEGHPARAATLRPADLPPSRVPALECDPPQHWGKYDPAYWRNHYEDFLWFFFGMCFPEPHSTKQIEDCIRWGLDTTPEVLVAEADAARPTKEAIEDWCRTVASPSLAIHGDHDLISPISRGRRLAELTGGDLIVLEGAGHLPIARDPVKLNLLIRDFALSVSR
ncbi:alpha/beta fold hydrolase [Pedococcus sp. 2YAF34]|uniref:alpha/beta fold hydrolase n=1 Tax=Pedococcus sp. 2YAF34 TaxID=3233032 RepID=UPI003F982380